jgi:hypothetical protein
MRVAKRALLAIFLIGFCFCVCVNVYIQVSYASSMPVSAQPESGRTFLLEVNHDCYRYVNKRELERVDVARFVLYPLAFVCLFGFVAVKVVP